MPRPEVEVRGCRRRNSSRTRSLGAPANSDQVAVPISFAIELIRVQREGSSSRVPKRLPRTAVGWASARFERVQLPEDTHQAPHEVTPAWADGFCVEMGAAGFVDVAAKIYGV